MLFAAACVCSWRFWFAEELPDMLRWGGASTLAFAGIGLIKVWFWLELQTTYSSFNYEIDAVL